MKLKIYHDTYILDKYLVGILFTYIMAFASLYYQCPGLFSESGILPAWIHTEEAPKSWSEWWKQMNLLSFSWRLGLSVDHAMELSCIMGILLSMLALIVDSLKDRITFAMLWLLYFSLFQVGQTFLSFQWDILLLEAGFLAIMAAPTSLFGLLGSSASGGDTTACAAAAAVVVETTSKTAGGGKKHKQQQHRDVVVQNKPVPGRVSSIISVHMVRWLLFRLMFASGVVKLTSGCPTWWGLTALHWHYESQCLPTPLAWYFHHMPDWFHRWSVVATYVIEIGIPFLFFVPTYRLRRFCFYSQCLLQVLIIFSGNYNFFNVLTMVLCLSLLPNRKLLCHPSTRVRRIFLFLFDHAIIVGLFCLSARLFALYVQDDWTVHSNIVFSKEQLQDFLSYAVPVSMWVSGAILLGTIALALVRVFDPRRSSLSKVRELLSWAFVTTLAVVIFCASLTPYSSLYQPTMNALPKETHLLYQRLHRYEIVNSYGLFRRMTGVGGRPEVIIEGSQSKDGPWLEYEFLYKPGNLSRAPSFVAPHQPRLDWQMWFAALSEYHQQPWLIHLTYRLLRNEPAVVKLLQHNPFAKEAPQYVRATRYTYHFMPMDHKTSDKWWYREKPTIYMPPTSLKDESLTKLLGQTQIIGRKPPPSDSNVTSKLLVKLRSMVESSGLDGFSFVSQITAFALFVRVVSRFVLAPLP